MEDIKFDVGETTETSIRMNSARKHNLRPPSLIFELSKKERVSFTAFKERIVPSTKITTKSDQPHKEQPIKDEPPIGRLSNKSLRMMRHRKMNKTSTLWLKDHHNL